MTTSNAAKNVDHFQLPIEAKIDRKHLEAAMKKLGVPASDKDAPLVLAKRLIGQFKVSVKPADMGQCDECKGDSDMSLEACPFCGTVEDSGDSESTESGDVQKVPDAPVSDVLASANDAGAQPAGETADDMAAKKTAKKAAAKAPKKGAEPKAEAAAPIQKAASTAVTSPVALDAAIVEVQRLKAASSTSMWQLGRAIANIFDAQLWKLRNDAEGKPRYKGFDPFVIHELGMTSANAYKLMDVAKNFTEEAVGKFGTSKLSLILEAPAEEQPRLREQVEKGASKRDIEREVRETNKKNKGKAKAPKAGRKAMPSGGVEAAAKAKAGKRETITIASITGKKTVKLFCKPASKNVDLKTLKRAKKIGDVPWGTLELENDVTMYFHLQESPGGELVLVVETKREQV